MYYGHQYDATVARVSPCGRWVASGDAAGHVRVWALPTLVAANDDQDDHRHDETFALKAEHRPLSGAVDDLAWSEDGQRIVACGDGRGGVFARVFMWDSGNQLGDASGPTKRVLSCAFRPSRPFRVVTASEDFGVAHFKGPPFKFDKTPHRHQNYVNCVRYNADGSLFATVGSDGVGVICEGTEGAPAARIPGKAKAPPRWMKKKPGAGLPGDDEEEGHVGTVYACAWAPPGAEGGARNVLVTVGADKTVRVWRVPEDLRVDAANDDAAPPRAVADLPACASVRATTFGDSVGDMCVGCAFVDATRVAVLTLDGAIRIERVDDVMTVADDSEGRDASTTSSASRGGREGEGETTSVLLSRGHPKPVVAMAGAGLGAVHAASLAGDAATCGGRSVVCRWSESRDPRNGASVALPESAGAVRAAMAVARRTGASSPSASTTVCGGTTTTPTPRRTDLKAKRPPLTIPRVVPCLASIRARSSRSARSRTTWTAARTARLRRWRARTDPFASRRSARRAERRGGGAEARGGRRRRRKATKRLDGSVYRRGRLRGRMRDRRRARGRDSGRSRARDDGFFRDDRGR